MTMHFHHLHFYVRNTERWKQWFIRKLAFQSASTGLASVARGVAVLVQGHVEIRLSSPAEDAAAKAYLEKHPPGLVDVAFATEHFEAALSHARAQGAQLLSPVTLNAAGQRQCLLKGWAHLRHTLVEVSPDWVKSRQARLFEAGDWAVEASSQNLNPQVALSDIDHVVINVPQGELAIAATWYQKMFGLEPGQQFEINTAHSGLRSLVLVHPDGPVQLPINEPSSSNSQIQEFLDHNGGTGVQHVALRSPDAVSAIAQFRQQGLDLLQVPAAYYDSLPQRPDCPLKDLRAIREQQLLIDWPQGGNQGMLLQTFTRPIFAEPTFFFEIIERSRYQAHGRLQSTQGFGEGNFQALFEAIERTQAERGSLQ
ncbi:MAG: 4-hydroxyphenylpyruvate dioxygenase [Cyanobacteria bacterium J06614_10]